MSTRRGIFGVLAGAVAAPVVAKVAPATAGETWTVHRVKVSEINALHAKAMAADIEAIRQHYSRLADLAEHLGLATDGLDAAYERQVDLIRSGAAA